MAVTDFPDVHDVLGKQAKIALYGKSGIGKTYLVTRLKNVLILDSEEGALSSPPGVHYARVEQIEEVFASDRERFPSFVVPIFHPRDIDQIAERLLRKANRGRFRTVVVDTMTSLFDMVYLGTTRRDFQSGATEVVKSVDGRDVMGNLTVRGHGLSQTRVLDDMTLFRDARTHIVWTFHEGTTFEDDVEVLNPLIAGKKLLPKLQGMMDFGIRVEMRAVKMEDGSKRSERVLRCRPSAAVWAKNRGPHGDELREFEPPDLQRIIDIIAHGAEAPEQGALPGTGTEG